MDDNDESFPIVCENGCPEGYLGRHKFSCSLARTGSLHGDFDTDTAMYLIFETDDSPLRDQALEWLHNFLVSDDSREHLLVVQDLADDMLDRIGRKL